MITIQLCVEYGERAYTIGVIGDFDYIYQNHQIIDMYISKHMDNILKIWGVGTELKVAVYIDNHPYFFTTFTL